MSDPTRVAVAMSGGVDSSVAAALLSEAGMDVFGLMLRLETSDSGSPNPCCSPSDVATARSVAAKLGIPFYVVDAREAFEESVISPFVRGYAQGLTPNPCIECNRSVRFGRMLDHALSLGAAYLATGHYARVVGEGPTIRLQTAHDPAKDQSYVLHMLTQRQLAHILFPLGDLTKAEVRAHARRMQLAAAERPESQDLCFVHGDYRAFLEARGIRSEPGPIVDRGGNVLGTHAGLPRYTLGQRKGLGLSGARPQYVLEKDVARNALIVGRRDQVGMRRFSVSRVSWVAGHPPGDAFETSVQVRYHAPRVAGRITCASPGEVHVDLAVPHPDAAPGQSAVFYDGPTCLGGGIITL